jgi:uncharacterized protein with HEPN domain
MSPREWQARVDDILDAIDEIQRFTAGMDFESFRNDARTMRAVELDFIIIGEAASQVPEDVQTKHAEIPWHLMRGIRNRIVHVYFSMDPQMLWETVTKDLPQLIGPLQRLR